MKLEEVLKEFRKGVATERPQRMIDLLEWIDKDVNEEYHMEMKKALFNVFLMYHVHKMRYTIFEHLLFNEHFSKELLKFQFNDVTIAIIQTENQIKFSCKSDSQKLPTIKIFHYADYHINQIYSMWVILNRELKTISNSIVLYLYNE